ncbi:MULTISPECIES: carbohydrate ABC transporter permease [unclassified Actinomyces]|uniref:carbohydrate ABC transporter permease n=1 Tax=unclassified Actinomyces TaxID=2609248 RepID=UPI0020173B71|nr:MULTISPECIES: carbohydrate ABC transporter permease [unclassified Actinomyces]MCL3777151.1 carbohydrate ABC transporter permease [Actinomyces sp. AC-20-1]MCL3790937.1 carbohydrate ABC transporter permease [Actinomyces sp. 187325]MCL3793204.1 carbohydrate ABC transporter permease [Actinomyces sp. 186855]MCL3793909.1 carbohydrate ABC transporter permease [Actinomyces sp. 217892]
MTATTAAPTMPVPATHRRRQALPWGPWPVYLFAALVVVALLMPVAFVLLGGFRNNSQLTTDPAGLPNPWILDNYLTVMSSSGFWQQILNSTIVASIGTVCTVTFGLMVSFVIARYPFAGGNWLYSLFAAGLMFPMTVAITPLYILIRNLGMMNSLAGIIIPGIAFALPQTVIILVPFLRAIPKEIEEAAQIDGAGRMRFFWRIVVPLATPGVVTTGILTFVGSWNSYMVPLFILTDPSKYTLPLGVQAFASEHSVNTAQVLAFTSLSMIPALIVFSLFERRIVGGLTGAVKG